MMNVEASKEKTINSEKICDNDDSFKLHGNLEYCLFCHRYEAKSIKAVFFFKAWEKV